MTESVFETFLARIYVDEEVRLRFLSKPREEAQKAGLQPDEIEAVVNIDRIGLDLLAKSLERKRQNRHVKPASKLRQLITRVASSRKSLFF